MKTDMSLHEEKVKKVGEILDGMSKIDTSKVLKKDGNLDVREFNRLPEVREAVEKIKKLGWTKEVLRDHFFVAAMILQFEIPKEKEVFISDEDRAMQVNTEIRPEPGIISDRKK